ncbi:MAG: hypothetical protein GY861_05105 [bacterium]|nr:hypothetical protein [bacterium]
MKTEISTKKLLNALLNSYVETHDLEHIYNGDGTLLTTLAEATRFIDELKEETMIKKHTMPVIHMNGSGEDSLRRQYNDLFEAVSEAQVKLLYDVDFHERDYYPLGELVWSEANLEREEIKQAMNKVYQYARQHMHYLDYGKEPLPDKD